jgi:hypothetical protein
MWFFTVCYAELYDPVYVHNGFLAKWVLKWPELYIRTSGSTRTILKNFLSLHHLTRSQEGPRNKNINMCRGFFGKIASPILMRLWILTAGDRVLAP